MTAARQLGPLVVGVCFLVATVSRGVVESFGVFVLPLQEAFGAGRSEIAAVYSLAMVTAGFAAPVVGWLFDRFGPQKLLAGGTLAMALGFVLAAGGQSLWQIRIGLGLLAGLGTAAMGQTPAAALISRWYFRRLATAMAFVGASTGIGMMAITPLAQVLVDLLAWRRALLMLGGLAALCLLPILIMPWRRVMAGDPSIMTPSGSAPAATDMRGALRRPAFWGLMAVYFCTAYTTLGVSVHVVPLLIETGYPPLYAASVFGAVGMLTPIGTLGWGWAADRFGRRRAVVLSYLSTLGGLGCLGLLLVVQAFPILVGFVLLFGGALGSRGPVVSSMAAQTFGREHLATIYGSIAVGIGLGAGLGSWVHGVLYDVYGSYGPVLLSGAGSLFLGLLPFLVIADLKRH